MVDNKFEKEKIAGIEGRQRSPEEFVTVESPRTKENVEALSWMEKLERRFGRTPKQAPSDVQDDTTQAQTAQQQPPVTVPITAAKMEEGEKLGVEFSLAWLVVWVKRKIKKLMQENRKVLFLQEPVKKEEEKK